LKQTYILNYISDLVQKMLSFLLTTGNFHDDSIDDFLSIVADDEDISAENGHTCLPFYRKGLTHLTENANIMSLNNKILQKNFSAA
jgi:hypothetical protein